MGRRKNSGVSSKSAGEVLGGPHVRLANRLAEVVIDGLSVLKVKDREVVMGQILGRLSAACAKVRADRGPTSDEHGD